MVKARHHEEGHSFTEERYNTVISIETTKADGSRFTCATHEYCNHGYGTLADLQKVLLDALLSLNQQAQALAAGQAQ